jgi:hypothetical protein
MAPSPVRALAPRKPWNVPNVIQKSVGIGSSPLALEFSAILRHAIAVAADFRSVRVENEPRRIGDEVEKGA